MLNIGQTIKLGFLSLLLIMTVTNAQGAERILSFESGIVVSFDGSMIVAETIRVQAEGAAIRRGIFRDLPTRYEDQLGNRIVVGFEVLSVSRDGRTEPWYTERRFNGVRVYAGDAEIFFTPGEYSYTIRYRTTRQLGFFEDHDELYWNVTGNGWSFVIDQASATVALPGSVSADEITMAGFTGRFGEIGQLYTSDVVDSGASIRTLSVYPVYILA